MNIDRLLDECRLIRFMPDGTDTFGQQYNTAYDALEEAKQGRLDLDCTNFVVLLGLYLFENESCRYNRYTVHQHAIHQACKPTIERLVAIEPVDERAHTMMLASHAQWLIRASDDDERLLGLTLSGVEAHTLDEWLERHSDMIPEALAVKHTSHTLVADAALFSDEWLAKRFHPVDPATNDGYRYRLKVFHIRERKRMRTRSYCREQIKRAREQNKVSVY